MARRLPQDVVDGLYDAMLGGTPYKEAAKQFGVGPAVALRIRTGTHASQRLKRNAKEYVPGAHRFYSTEYSRCPGCGGKVLFLCLACKIRRAKESERIKCALS